MANHDIVTIGASAGGVEPLLDLVAELPANFPATLFVVLHTAADYLSPLPALLSARGPLPAVHPVHGDPITRGRIYVAPPDNHLLVRPGFVEVVRGARENGHRPAVDPLFRTASQSYGPRVIGVVLSGYQDCGTAGIMSIKARGGLAVVQDPETATVPEMPESVIDRVRVDHVVHPRELPELLDRLVARPTAANASTAQGMDALEGNQPGAPTGIVCPLCHGFLTEANVGEFHHFRCHEGHAFSLHSLAQQQGEEVERALWAAARSLDESAAVNSRLGATSSSSELRRRFSEKGDLQRRQAELIRQLLLREEASATPDPSSS